MVKKRIIFTLLYDSGSFSLSRNFNLQKIGNIAWIEKNYNLPKVITAIDELVVLDVSRENRDIDSFCNVVKRLVELCFVPVAVGGGISDLEQAEKLLKSGADKIVLNSAYYDNKILISELVARYGKQFLVASMDVARDGDSYKPVVSNGAHKLGINIDEYIGDVIEMGVGEIYINSIDRDGTGQGLDVELVEMVARRLLQESIPLVVAGGCGNSKHILQGISVDGVDAVATANILNFIGNAFPEARDFLLENHIPLAAW